MKIAIMQPYLFPYIGYFHLINTVDIFVIYDDVNYIKRGWINRNRILLNGKEHRITLPLKKASPNKLINEISVDSDIIKRKKLLKTIKHGYSKAPYYKDVIDLVEKVIFNKEKNLAKFIGYSFKTLCDYLDIKTQFIFSSNIEKNNNLKGVDKGIEICKKLNCNVYINSIGGKKLYSKDMFNNHGIELYFIESNNIKYNQFNNEFVPNLSIIDITMFNSKERIKTILDQYSLI